MTSFQEKVCRVVRKIPKGKTLSYKTVAKLVGSPRAWRAVGNALKKNRDLEIPCHRVIKSDGKTGGYRGGVENKIKLLRSEHIISYVLDRAHKS